MATFDLPLDTATIQTIGSHQYYIFPSPTTHKNDLNRPTTYPEHLDKNPLPPYAGAGSNGAAKLRPGTVHAAANRMMAALRQVGDQINDWSMKSAIIQNGWREDGASQGKEYLRIIKDRIKNNPEIFGELAFPTDLETEAQSALGRRGDARREAFRQHVANAPGWSAQLVFQLFDIDGEAGHKGVDRVYAPQGFNPHATGLVFDLDFMIYIPEDKKKKTPAKEKNLGANAGLNAIALSNAAGMWLNMYSMQFDFDSYDTGAEVFHQEFRKPNDPADSQ
jgi:hypothetical protein